MGARGTLGSWMRECAFGADAVSLSAARWRCSGATGGWMRE